ncbi:MAG: hypothetical protein FAF03_03340 [Epsilonproteobacteria bacterium]|nr:hypothetical protein [Campylobacterota bacterium]
MQITIKTTQPIENDGVWDESMLYFALFERMQSLADKFVAKSTYKGKKEFNPSRIIEKIDDSKLVAIPNISSPSEIEIDEDWYAFEKHYGTSAEKEFVEFIETNIIKELQAKFIDVKLIRNELVFKIHDFTDGRGFAPDFIFMLTKEECTYQVFCEPKGEHLKDGDKWKKDFMAKINEYTNDDTIILKNKDGELDYDIGCYKIFGTKFYIQGQSKEFEDSFRSAVKFD